MIFIIGIVKEVQNSFFFCCSHIVSPLCEGRLLIMNSTGSFYVSHIPESFLKNISLQVVRHPLLWATLLYEE